MRRCSRFLLIGWLRPLLSVLPLMPTVFAADGASELPPRHLPRMFVGRNFWRVLYKYGDWACWEDWSTPARRVRFDNREIYDCPAFRDVAWSYFGRNPPPDPLKGKTVWRRLGENFLAGEPDREILVGNPDPSRPFYLTTTGKRKPSAWNGDVDLDHAEYGAFVRTHPNLVYDGWCAEWCNDILSAYSRLDKVADPRQRARLEAVVGKRPPTDRYELVDVLRRYFAARRKTFYDGRVCVLDAHLNSFHAAFDCEAHMISLETTDSTGNGTTADEKAYFHGARTPADDLADANDNSFYRWNVSAMFARGAARQFQTVWEWYIAGYTNGWTEDGKWRNNVVCVYPESDTAVSGAEQCGYTCGAEFGQSASNLRSAHYFA